MRAIFLSLIFFVSCKPKTVESNNEPLSSQLNSLEVKNDFKEFWNNLGKALLVNDTIALDNYLDSTVSFYGRDDDDPKFELKSRDRIIQIRKIYLSGGFYDYQNDATIDYRDFFLNRNALDNDYVEGQDSQDIKDFVFKRNKRNEWKLIRVYTDTKTKGGKNE